MLDRVQPDMVRLVVYLLRCTIEAVHCCSAATQVRIVTRRDRRDSEDFLFMIESC